MTDEKFFAWLDGELDAAQAAEVEAKVVADPQLQRLAEQHRALSGRLKGAFDPIAAAPVPHHLQAMLYPPAEVIDFAQARKAREAPNWRPAAQWAAMAATLALGVFLGTLVPQRGGGPVEVQGGKLYAAASLTPALNTELASAPSGDVRIGLTFRDQAGEICRTFSEPAASGLACRQDGHWKLKGVFGAPEGQGTSYRMAAGMDPNLAALVDSSMTGEPFNAGQERAAREHGWR